MPRKSHGRRSLVGCSPGGCEESDTTDAFTFTFHFHALEKEMATHSSVLAWRIPGMGEPGGLLSMGSHSLTRLKRLSSSYNLREGIWLNDRTLEILAGIMSTPQSSLSLPFSALCWSSQCRHSPGGSTGLPLWSSLLSASFDPEPLCTSHSSLKSQGILYLSFPIVF